MAVDPPKYGDFTRLDPDSYRQTLAQALSGRELVDPLRDLCTFFGIRHYEVRVIRVRWSGGERGSGEPYYDPDFAERGMLIEPTPRITKGGVGNLNESVEGVGVEELGIIRVDRISTAYDENYLKGLLPHETRHPRDVEAWWSITFFGQSQPVRRRFNVAKVPGRHTLGWEVVLERADGADPDPVTKELALSKPTEDPL
jgi:hypothetical protein